MSNDLFDSKYGMYRKKGTDEDKEAFLDVIVNLSSALGKGRIATNNHIFEYGVEKLIADLDENKQAPQRGDPNYRSWCIMVEAARIRREQREDAELFGIYKKLGHEGFVAWHEEKGLPVPDEFLSRIDEFEIVKDSQAVRVDAWLKAELLDHKPHTVEELKLRARANGFGDIPWNTITQRAVRVGYTGTNGNEKGVWQWLEHDTDKAKILSFPSEL